MNSAEKNAETARECLIPLIAMLSVPDRRERGWETNVGARRPDDPYSRGPHGASKREHHRGGDDGLDNHDGGTHAPFSSPIAGARGYTDQAVTGELRWPMKADRSLRGGLQPNRQILSYGVKLIFSSTM